MGHQRAFELLFGRSTSMLGSEKMGATEQAVREHIVKLASHRNMPARRASGRMWSHYQVLSPSCRRMVDRYDEALIAAGLDHRGHWTANLRWTPEYLMPAGRNMGTLVRNSLVWNFQKRRCMLPLELMEVPCHAVCCAEDNPHRCSFIGVLESLRDSSVRSIAGNGMHLRVVALVIAFVLACAEVPHAPPRGAGPGES